MVMLHVQSTSLLPAHAQQRLILNVHGWLSIGTLAACLCSEPLKAGSQCDVSGSVSSPQSDARVDSSSTLCLSVYPLAVSLSQWLKLYSFHLDRLLTI